MTDHITDKSIMITGAGGGFGKLVSQKAAALGAKVTCIDIDKAAVEASAKMIGEAGGQALAVVADVTDLDDLKSAVAQAI
ncbi:MAG: SDR family NAD(P)-dependent oxidoreductase, partial [Pseudomonadota bacterium]